MCSSTQDDSINFFDAVLNAPMTSGKHLGDELDRYLKADTEDDVVDPLRWWHKHADIYPRLSRMALNYLSIPRAYASSLFKHFYRCTNPMYSSFLASSVEVERVFSRGRLLLSHVRSALSPESTRAVLCLGQWSLLDLIDDGDLKDVARMAEVDGDGSDDEDFLFAEAEEPISNHSDSDDSD